MVSNHPAKFGSLKHCGSRDLMLLVIEEQDSNVHLLPSLSRDFQRTGVLRVM